MDWCSDYIHRGQERGQKFAKGAKEGVWETEVPSGVQGQSPGEGPRSRGHMVNIRLNKMRKNSTQQK